MDSIRKNPSDLRKTSEFDTKAGKKKDQPNAHHKNPNAQKALEAPSLSHKQKGVISSRSL